LENPGQQNGSDLVKGVQNKTRAKVHVTYPETPKHKERKPNGRKNYTRKHL